jgi:hypothetical protein
LGAEYAVPLLIEGVTLKEKFFFAAKAEGVKIVRAVAKIKAKVISFFSFKIPLFNNDYLFRIYQ